MFCASVAAQRGLRVVLIDHAARIGEKIRISGGGRCNFTNLHTGPANFLSANPRFCRSALARYTPQDFIALMKQYRIAFHEKHRGQLFCDGSAQQIIDLLRAECDAGQVAWRAPCKVKLVRPDADGGYTIGLETAEGAPAGLLQAKNLVVACGGLSIPKIGASDLGYRLAKQFGINVITPRPALVPLTFAQWPYAHLAGLSLEVELATTGPYGKASFREDLLFTHHGLSGPAGLQISSHWMQGEQQAILANLAPEADLQAAIVENGSGRSFASNTLEEWLPKRLAEAWSDEILASRAREPLATLPRAAKQKLADHVQRWRILPDDTEGYRKAEVTAGGVDTRALSSQTMESTTQKGLYFIGEVVDVTGHLGGFNFQWAWASAMACGQAVG